MSANKQATVLVTLILVLVLAGCGGIKINSPPTHPYLPPGWVLIPHRRRSVRMPRPPRRSSSSAAGRSSRRTRRRSGFSLSTLPGQTSGTLTSSG